MDWSTLIATLAVLLAIVALYFETRRSRVAIQTEAILSLSDRFDSSLFRDIRRKAAKKLLEAKPAAAELSDVLNFLSTIAFFVKTHAFDKDLVYYHFSWWMIRYWHAASGFIEQERQTDPDSWIALERLIGALQEKEQLELHPRDAYSAERIASFLRRESRLP